MISLVSGNFPKSLFDQADIELMAPFFTIYYFFLIFFLIAVFASIYIDFYRKIVMEYGERYSGSDISKYYVLWC